MRRRVHPLAHLALLTLVSALHVEPARAQTGDVDLDGLSDAWEVSFGLDPLSAAGDDGRDGDPDHDGVTNLDEQFAQTHPRGAFTSTFAEGSTGTFFDTRFALFNTDGTKPARVLLRFLTGAGEVVTSLITIPPLTRTSVDPETIRGLESTAFSTVIEADAEVVSDRTMWWDEERYGSHTETGGAGPAQAWFLAEGATHSGFDLFYLLQNPGTQPASVTVTYLLPSGSPIVKSYSVAARSRFNVWVDLEEPALASTDVSAAITSSVPIVVERAMYLSPGGRLFEAGHASAAVRAPALQWHIAEGATGDYFDEYVLVANPGADRADAVATFLLPDGTTVEHRFQVPPTSRVTLWVDGLDPRLADTSLSASVRSINDVPIVVERAMWWPGSRWFEAHNSAGSTSTGPVWGLAEGEAGGSPGTWTYVLVANTGDTSADVDALVTFEDGGSRVHSFTSAPHSRYTLDVWAVFPDEFSNGSPRRFSVLVRGTAASAPQLIVERAMYADSGGVPWASGTNALGTLLVGSGAGVDATTARVSIGVADADANETGIDRAAFVVSRSSSAGTLVVPLVVGGTADASDYGPLPREVVFAPGVTSVSLIVTPADDGVVEATEQVIVTLAAAPGYVITVPTASAYVFDNDVSATPLPATDDVARFLDQGTFGPTMADIDRVRATGYSGWIAEQIAAPRSSFLGYLDAAALAGEAVTQNHLQEAWFQAATVGPDQLRQRVANALLEILVVGTSNGLQSASYELAAYMDILMRGAFGNFRTLIEDVTLSPTMGRYLDMLRNQKEDTRTGRIPNENYARELLQLFTIGLYELNPDGTVKRDADGTPIDTYGQEEISGFARVFTGWTFNQTAPPVNFFATADWRNPMVQVVDTRGAANRHSTLEKPLLGVTLPAITGTATVEQATAELRAALDVVFAHPNIGPFIGRQMIQRLVTGNPSPAYVARVAATFDNNGAGVRGDLGAVVRAILLDPEARDTSAARNPYYGHMREPMIRYVSVLRAFGGRAASGKYKVYSLQNDMGQAPFRSPSVFNFFAPDYRRPGEIAEAGLDSPEFQIASETTVIRAMNTMRSLVYRSPGTNLDAIVLDLSTEQALANDPGQLLERLDALLFAGAMSADLKSIARDAVTAIPTNRPLDRARSAVYLLVTSPEYVVQK